MRGAPISENEGKYVYCGPHCFRIVNGVRVWQSPVPYQNAKDIILEPYQEKSTKHIL